MRKSISRNTHPRCNKFVIFLLSVCVLLFAAFLFMFFKTPYPHQIKSAFGRGEYTPHDETQLSWNKSLNQLNYSPDIIFFGDSLTIGTDFQSAFPDKSILNFGRIGDNLSQMRNRAHIVSKLSSSKVFIMGGVNSLDDLSIEQATMIYENILDLIKKDNPDVEIYIQSILPISKSAYTRKLTNKSIEDMNGSLQTISQKYHATFIDLHTLFLLNGELNPAYTVDGVHLNDDGKDVWINGITPFI